MGIGKMQSSIAIKSHAETFDSEGFSTFALTTVAECRAMKEERFGNEAWINDARFSQASVAFVFRKPSSSISSAMVIVEGTDVWNIIDIQSVEGNGLWLRAICRKENPSG